VSEEEEETVVVVAVVVAVTASSSVCFDLTLHQRLIESLFKLTEFAFALF
jgi:hypothetical protein